MEPSEDVHPRPHHHERDWNGHLGQWGPVPVCVQVPQGQWILKWHRTFNTARTWTTAGHVSADRWPNWIRPFSDY